MKKQNNIEQIDYHEDEIDLAELLSYIVKHKAMLFCVTAFATACAAIFAFLKTPVYEAKATVEIGKASVFSSAGKHQNILFEKSNVMKNRLQQLYKYKFDKINDKGIFKIAEIKGTDNLVEITFESADAEDAADRLNECVSKIINEHKEKYDYYLSLFNKKINLVKIETDELIKQKDNLEKEIKLQKANIEAVSEDNPVVAAVYTIDLNRNYEALIKIKNRIYVLSNKLNEYESAISSENIKPTAIIGDVFKNPFPVKPKKKTIVLIGFVLGIFFSLFTIFLVEFVKKNEK